MLELEEARHAALRELDDLIARLAAAPHSAWNAPTRCTGWQIRDLAGHVAMVLIAQAEALDRMRRKVTDPVPLGPPMTGSEHAVLAAIRTGRTSLATALAALTPHDLANLCPLPFATIPGGLAIQLVAAEQGIHANDLAWALGDEVPLPPDVATAIAAVMSAALPMMGAAAPAPPSSAVSYDLIGDTTTLRLRRYNDAWVVGGDGAAACRVGGTDSAVMLFVMGRIPATHPSLSIAGDPAAAANFKRYFPGP